MDSVSIKSYNREDEETKEYLKQLDFYSHIPTTIMAIKIQHPFRVDYANGTSSYGIGGDYLVRDTNGHLYTITKKEFEKNWILCTEATI